MSTLVPSFRTLLYRYFFFAWLFKDVNQGNVFERSAAWHHNQEQAIWLATYARRWSIFGCMLFLIGAAFETLLQLPVASALFYVPSVLALPINVVIGLCWMGLRAPF